jgi:hypothetical protein
MKRPKGPHGPHHGHGPEWIVSVQDDVSREQYAGHLSEIADALAVGNTVEINGTTVKLPDDVEFVLRYERTPHGSYALVIRVEWYADGAGGEHGVPTSSLQIRSTNGSATA